MRAHQIQTLNEINMSPRSLQREAAAIDATVGIEFEMVVPGYGSGGGDDEMEPDYGEDRRARSIRDIVDFFHDGDHNGRRAAQRLEEALIEDYHEWFNDHAGEEWDKVEREKIQEWVEENEIDVDDSIEEYLEDTLNLSGQELRVVLAAGKRAGEFTNSKQLRLWAEENDPYKLYREAADAVAAEVDRLVDRAISTKNETHSSAYESWMDEFRDDNWDDLQENWLEAEGLRRMTDIENNYANEIMWPYWVSSDTREEDIGTVVRSFERGVGVDAHYSTAYHGAQRSSVNWSIEPDGSIHGDDGESGLEFVSPPLPLSEMVTAIRNVYTWAGQYGCYTNDSTGLHMNVSIPDYKRDRLDFVKLALLLGDQYVLEQFGRESNSYCRSAWEKVAKAGRNKPDTVLKVFDLLRGRLDDVASHMIHNTYTDKYTSINVKDTHVEFRGPGGDYLEEDINEKILPTLYRFVVVLDAACDPDKYRQEYMKKLYKALAPTSPELDLIELFVRWRVGTIDSSTLRNQLDIRRIHRSRDRTKYWWKVWRIDNSVFTIEVPGMTEEEAKAKAIAEVPEWQRDGIAGDALNAIRVRPYEEPEDQQTSEPDRVVPGSTLDLVRQRAARAQQSQGSSGVGETVPREWTVRGRDALRGETVWSNNEAQARRVARMMYPNLFPSDMPDDEIVVAPVD